MKKPPKINRKIRLIIKKTIADYLNDYIHNKDGLKNITITSINKVSEKLSHKVCDQINTNYNNFYFREDTCNNCFYGQYSPTCGKPYGQICDNGWGEFYLRWLDE